MGYKKINDYGIIGNGLTLAHVGIDGSIDWMCLPFLDSPSVFAAMLDDRKGGRFRVQPTAPWDSVQTYVPCTNILQTSFRTSSGTAEILDFMAAGPEAEKVDTTRTLLVRRIRGKSGTVQLQVELTPRFQYAKRKPDWKKNSGNWWTAQAEEEKLHFFISKPSSWEEEQTILEIGQGETIWICTAYGEIENPPDVTYLTKLLIATKEYWVKWVRSQETGKYHLHGFRQEALDRSALVLKLLQFRETGAIAAAASCSLPTIIYGERNWDYRFSWVRDTSMTLQALFELGHTREVSLYLEWLKKILQQEDCSNLEVLYKLREPIGPDGETALNHLNGYKGSRPVLTGQFNIGQQQHDIYGELLEMIFSMSRLVGKIDPNYWIYIKKIVDHVVKIWRNPDNGIWELRTGPHHVTHSKIMCWVALDRGIKIAGHYGFPADLETWKKERAAVHADVLANAYNRKRKSFTQHYDTEDIDAALLQIPIVGFLPAEDERVINTIKAIEKELMVDGLPLRYTTNDGLPGQEHGWLICLFWYLRCLIRQKRFAEVEAHLRQVGQYGNHLGLFGEEYDTTFKEITGNFPQAFSHIGYATTILEYIDARRKKTEPPRISLFNKIQLFLHPRNLTPAIPDEEITLLEDPGAEIKRIMNILQGQFYDGHKQRVDYGLIRSSEYFHDFLRAVASLKKFDPATLPNEAAKIAFWTNVFNTLVIHGVIELGIQDSVKEVPFFFERVKYRIGQHQYTLSDIEHGILRANKVPPYRFGRRLKSNDPRLAGSISHPDARIHFALVCASRTCPPIEAYTEELLDEQLDASAKVFINATTHLDRKNDTIGVSMIFKWYRDDFESSVSDLLRYIAEYLYDSESADWIRNRAETLRIRHTPYDWRLNR